jgi:SAM-dependent methyltransferase
VLKYRNHYHDDYGSTEINGNRNLLYSKIINFLEKKNKFEKLLDVGTGCGFFLVFAEQKGWEVYGIDPSPQSIHIAKSKNNLNASVNTLNEFKSEEKFDLITFINVLDHSPMPWKEIEHAKQLLTSDGQIFIRIPNGFLHSHLLKIGALLGIENRISKLLVFHEYSFNLKYIKRLLTDYEFDNIEFQNSPPSEKSSGPISITKALRPLVRKMIYIISEIIKLLTFNHILLAPSLWVIATQKKTKKLKLIAPNRQKGFMRFRS